MNSFTTNTYGEASDQEQVRAVPFSHLSIEVGHPYLKDTCDRDKMLGTFRRAAPWISTAVASLDTPGHKPRVSTCFLVDDYFSQCEIGPEGAIENLLKTSAECGISIDYIARESAFAVADGISLADLAAARLLHEPAPGTNGSRPSVFESGWLCNGERSPGTESDQAMRIQQWRPPTEFSKRHHSVFVDIELWAERDQRTTSPAEHRKTWSCAFLAAVWQLQRLGMLRYHGQAVAQPRPLPAESSLPKNWEDLPPVIRINPHAAPFSAYRTLSILPRRYIAIENAVRIILGHLSLDDTVTEQVVKRAAAEDMEVPRSVVDRVSHIFVEGL